MTRVRLTAVFGALVAVLVLAFPASASRPMTGSGTGMVTSIATTSSRAVGTNVVEERDVAGMIDTGPLNGTFTEHVRGVIHQGGLLTFRGTMTFNGSVEGCGSGMVTLGVSGYRASAGEVVVTNVNVIDAASNTIAVHGVGIVDQAGWDLTYQVQYQCQ